MRISKMWNIRFWKMWVGFRFVPYEYSGNDGRKVTGWILYLGFIQIEKERYGIQK